MLSAYIPAVKVLPMNNCTYKYNCYIRMGNGHIARSKYDILLDNGCAFMMGEV